MLISTMPITQLITMAGLDGFDGAAAALSYSTVHVVGIGIEGRVPAELADRKWIYFPQPDLPFYRMTVLSNFAQSNAPAGHVIVAEVQSLSHPSDDRRLSRV